MLHGIQKWHISFYFLSGNITYIHLQKLIEIKMWKYSFPRVVVGRMKNDLESLDILVSLFEQDDESWSIANITEK